MKLLVTGGAGYIGSHVVLEALEEGFEVTVFDDLSTGLEQNINKRTKFVHGSTTSKKDLLNLFRSNKFDAVIHLAASKAAGESMIKPSKYAKNNIVGGINLLNMCSEYKVKFFIFSSTAAVYGIPEYTPIDEYHKLSPLNFYGYTKLVLEQNLKWFSELKGTRYASLRYFNAAGYNNEKKICGIELNPQNLIPKVLEVAVGVKPFINIYGNNYKTIDGTGVRDYIHVSDLALAHINSLKFLQKHKNNIIINLGTGKGVSVLQVINAVKNITKKVVNQKIIDPRFGDAPTVVASSELARKIIDWNPVHSDLETIIKSTWEIYKLKYKL